MKVIVCGGREFSQEEFLFYSLDRLHAEYCFDLLIHGGAKGADALAHRWALSRGVQPAACEANWNRFGSQAGPMRNANMLGLRPDLVVAFPGGRGTAHMVAIARGCGVKVRECLPLPQNTNEKPPKPGA